MQSQSTRTIVKRLDRVRRICQAMAKERYMNEPHRIRSEAAWRECIDACTLAGRELTQLAKANTELDAECQELSVENDRKDYTIQRLTRELEDLQPDSP